MLSTFHAKDFVRVGSLLLKDLVLPDSLALENRRNGGAGRRHGRWSIGPGARCREHVVRTASSPADDGVRRLIDGAAPILERLIRFLALDAQAFVGLSRSKRGCWFSGSMDAAKFTTAV
jgi:hypothetical protein